MELGLPSSFIPLMIPVAKLIIVFLWNFSNVSLSNFPFIAIYGMLIIEFSAYNTEKGIFLMYLKIFCMVLLYFIAVSTYDVEICYEAFWCKIYVKKLYTFLFYASLLIFLLFLVFCEEFFLLTEINESFSLISSHNRSPSNCYKNSLKVSDSRIFSIKDEWLLGATTTDIIGYILISQLNI